MRITDIRVVDAPLEAAMSNAVIEFSKITVSKVAVFTDATADGEPVVGYGFNSNGGYAQTGLLTERLLPRLAAAPRDDLLDDNGVLDPVAVRHVVMANEKPGGHGDRAVAVGTLDVAMWDAAAKAMGKPLYRSLHDRFRPAQEPAGSVWVYAAGGYYRSGDDITELRREIEGYLDLGHIDVKIKIGGASLARDLERIESVLEILPAGCRLAVDANGRFDVRTALEYASALTAYDLLWYEEPCDPLEYGAHAILAEEYTDALATGETSSPCRTCATWSGTRAAARPGHPSDGPVSQLRRLRVRRHAGPVGIPRLAAAALLPARRPQVQPRGHRRLPHGRVRVLPRGLRAIRRFADEARSSTDGSVCPTRRASESNTRQR